MLPLPIDPECTAIAEELCTAGALVLTAAPGSGKSTRVPPALLKRIPGRIMVLQPRRAAARQLARRVADERGWRAGREVGWQTRFERVGEADTRLWYATTGILRRRLQEDPTWEGVGCLVLDEFHERSADADVLLAWARELRTLLRPDLRVLVMSATMDAAVVARYLDAAVRTAGAAPHPVRTRFQAPRSREGVADQVLRAYAGLAPAERAAGTLVFLPGRGEIRSACQAVRAQWPELEVQELHGSQKPEEQDAVLQAWDGARVICATNIAETSLTVPGVRTVIDAGLQRVGRYDAESGFDSLELEPCSGFAADQRRGRAGREAPGVCVRLWSRIEDGRRPDSLEPEVQRSDPLPLCLDLQAWWGSEPSAFPWLDAPDPERLAQAVADLQLLGLVQTDGRLTATGRRVAGLPVHPRTGLLMERAGELDELPLAAAVAALLEGRDPHPRAGADQADGDDLTQRIDLLERDRELRRIRDELLRGCGWRGERAPGRVDRRRLLRLVLAAWPDRLAVRTGPGANRVRLPGGRSLVIDDASACHLPAGRRDRDLVLVLAGKRLRGRSGRRTLLRWGLCLDEVTLAELRPDLLVTRTLLHWDAAADRVQARRELRAGDLTLRVLADADPDPVAAAAELLRRLRPRGLELALADARLGPILSRYRWLQSAGLAPADWHMWEAEQAQELLEQACTGATSLATVRAADWLGLWQAQVGWQVPARVEELAPAQLVLPNGRTARLDYAAEPGPVLAARMQEFFACDRTPTIAGGRYPVVLHLQAPNGRTQQITDDLPGFWRRTWPQVRKDLRGRYGKHPWPEDPLAHPPCTPSGRPVRS